MILNSLHSIYPIEFINAHCPTNIRPEQLPLASELVKKETKEYGVGIYAQRPYMRGECVGHFIAESGHSLRQHSLQRTPEVHLVDPYFIGYLSHSCDPNVVLDMHQQQVFCIRDIIADEPLCMDYASTEDTLFRQFACGCNAPNCRQWVTGRYEPVNADGMIYLNPAVTLIAM